MKKFKIWSMMMLMAMVLPTLVACGGDSDGDSTHNANIGEYVGKWSCISPATYRSSTIVTEGTILVITASGSMTWSMTNGTIYTATLRALGDDWGDITYNGKNYRAEIYVSGNTMNINVNGNANLIVKDFPFDGGYKKITE